jgi:hypothetical protein
MRTSEHINELAAALAKAQPNFGHIERSKTVQVRTDKGTYSFAYAPLEEIISATRGSLNQHGLALVHPIESTDTHIVCGARLQHASGQYMESTITVPRPVKMQELGSCLTYIKRYCTQGVLGVQADDDDDANAADGNAITQQATKEQRPRAKPGTYSKKEEPHEKVKQEKLAALEAAGKEAFGGTLPIDDRRENPRDSVGKLGLGLAAARNMVVVQDADKLRKRIVENQADGTLTEDEACQIELAIVERIAELSNMTAGKNIKKEAAAV